MKATSLLFLIYLIAIGIDLCIFALTSFDPLLWICFQNKIVYRVLLSVAGIAALWMIFWLIAFKPFKNIH